MAINFPNSPSNNDIYTVNGKRWIYSNGKWSIYGSTAPDATASDTEPTGVGDGHIWYRSDQSQTLIRYDNTWVEVGSAGGFDNASTNFPTSLDSATGFAAVEALQAKVGVDSSAVTSSLDYKVAQLEAISHGKILQVVRATDSTERTTTSSTAVDANISVTITPISATSNILLVWSVHVDSRPGTQATSTLYITDSSNTVLDGTGDVSHGLVAATRNLYRSTFIAWASPATTSATTYKGRFQANSGSTCALLNHLAIGQLFALEIGA